MHQYDFAQNVQLRPGEYQAFRHYLQRKSGIDLGEGREYLVSTRMRSILASHDIGSISSLLQLLSGASQYQLHQKVIDAMTTNETLWFRDSYPFEYLKRKIFPELALQIRRPVRIWSAACSSGQEPYSIGMTVNEFNRENIGKSISAHINATDISTQILALAKEGVYDHLSVARGLSLNRLNTFFSRLPSGDWQLKPEILSGVDFQQFNLQNDRVVREEYDIVFCRNVLIYFNTDLKQSVFQKIYQSLNPGGYLFLGASENMNGIEHLFDAVSCQPGFVFIKR